MNNVTNQCLICSKSLSGRQKKFCSTRCKNKQFQSYASQKKRGIARKQKFIQVLGGMCIACGYKRNLAALSFHHNGDNKIKLDVRSLSNRTERMVMTEVKKCTLLCNNCHAELHNPDLDISKLSS